MVSRPGRPGGGEDESFSVTVWGAGGGKEEEEEEEEENESCYTLARGLNLTILVITSY